MRRLFPACLPLAACLVIASTLAGLVRGQPPGVPPLPDVPKQKLLTLDRPIFHPFTRHWLPHHTKTCNKRGVPAYGYANDVPRRSHTVVTLLGTPPEELPPALPTPARAAPVPPLPLPMADALGWRLDLPPGTPPPPALEVATAGAAPPVQRRRFIAPACRVDLLSVDQIGIALFNDGNLLFSGRLYDEGGEQRHLSGHTITLTVRARLGHANEMVEMLHGRKGGPGDGPTTWKIVHSQWLIARRPDTITLTATADPALRALFERITGFEITLEYEAPELADAFGRTP